MSDGYRKIVSDGLWNNNQALVALLGLCPLLAVSNTLINGLGLGLATTLVLTLSNASVSVIRHWVRPEIRLPVFVLIIASFVTTVELVMNAYFHGLHKVLGIFIPLIVTNCAIVARAELFASRNPVLPSIADGIGMGIGFACLLTAIGAFRELVGAGSVLAGTAMLAGHDPGTGFAIVDRGWLLALLPPGAFFSLALAVAAKNAFDQRQRQAVASGVAGRQARAGDTP